MIDYTYSEIIYYPYIHFPPAHIFFDDAMQEHDVEGGDDYEVNDYVKLLVETVDVAAR